MCSLRAVLQRDRALGVVERAAQVLDGLDAGLQPACLLDDPPGLLAARRTGLGIAGSLVYRAQAGRLRRHATLAEWLPIPRWRSSTRPRRRPTRRSATARSPRTPSACCRAGGRVLDVGCASGGLLALLRPRAGHLAGLELSAERRAPPRRRSPTTSCRARSRIPELPFAAAPSTSSCSPTCSSTSPIRRRGWRGRRRWCRPGGAVLVSVPNVAHWQARLTLLRGRWPQNDSGTFDASHLRWFTRDALARAARRRRPARRRAARDRARRCATTRPPRPGRSSAPGARLAGARPPRARAARLPGRSGSAAAG